MFKCFHKDFFKDFLELCKPRVVMLMLLTALVGMQLATPTFIPLNAFVFGIFGIALASAAGAVVNHLLDRHLDSKMARTQKRPLPQGRVQVKHAIIFAILLAICSELILFIFVNALTAILTFFTFIGYAILYTFYLKRTTPQNIVIGGLAGAMPPLLGWTAVTNSIDPLPLLLVLIIFAWTPPHFWALAIYRSEEYAKAGLPMLPVTHGDKFTKLNILLYTILMIVISILPYLIEKAGLIYLISSMLLGSVFVYWVTRLNFSPKKIIAMQTFRYSILYLMLLFLSLLIDHFYPVFLISL